MADAGPTRNTRVNIQNKYRFKANNKNENDGRKRFVVVNGSKREKKTEKKFSSMGETSLQKK